VTTRGAFFGSLAVQLCLVTHLSSGVGRLWGVSIFFLSERLLAGFPSGVGGFFDAGDIVNGATCRKRFVVLPAVAYDAGRANMDPLVVCVLDLRLSATFRKFVSLLVDNCVSRPVGSGLLDVVSRDF